MTPTARRKALRAVAELRAVSATAEEVHRRASLWPTQWGVPLTPSGLAEKWETVSKPGRRSSGVGAIPEAADAFPVGPDRLEV